MKKLLLIALGFILFTNLSAQFTVFGTDPSSIRWHQLDSAHFNLVFPDFALDQARQFQKQLLSHRTTIGLSMSGKSQDLSVLFHPYASSNGLVVWTPARMEINLLPPRDGLAQPWIEQLAIHEYRHIKQMELVGSGLAKIGYPLVGEIATGVMTLFVPTWLYEGDAVVMETALSHTGRGRSASFDMPFRALLADTSLRYSYDKLLLGSERDFVPDHYVYGYHFAAYVRKYYGADVWDKIIRDIAWRPFLIQPKHFSICKFTGNGQKTLQDNAWIEWKKIWADRALGSRNFEKMAVARVNAFEPKNFVSSTQAFTLKDGTLLYCESNRKELDRWMIKAPNKEERELYTPGRMNGKAVFEEPYLIWPEYLPHPRYEMSNQSVVHCLNVLDGTSRYIKQSYFNRVQAMSFGANGMLWVLSITEQGNYRLDGISNLSKVVYTHEWTPQGQERVTELFHIDALSLGFLTGNESGLKFQKFSLRDRARTELFPLGDQWNSIQHTVGYENGVLFSSDCSGVDNIYSFSLETGAITQLSNARFGAFYPWIQKEKSLLWVTDYTARGKQILAFPLDSCEHLQVDFTQTAAYPMAEMLKAQEQVLADSARRRTAEGASGQLVGRSSGQATEPFSKQAYHGSYRGLSRQMNVHSWAPLYFDPNTLSDDLFSKPPRLGAIAMTQNLLGNMYGHMAYTYLNHRHAFQGSLSYSRYWPIISLSTRVNEKKRVSHGIENITDLDGTHTQSSRFEEDIPSMELGALVSFPYQSSFGAWNYGAIGQIGVIVNNTRLDIDPSLNMHFRSESYVDAACNLYIKRRLAILDLYPQWGIQLSMRQREHFSGAQQKNISFMLFLPGFTDNHSLRLSAGTEYQSTQNNIFSPMLPRVRFIDNELPGSSSLQVGRVDYALPLFYPDSGIPFLLYVKKIHLNMFAEGLWTESFDLNSPNKSFYGAGGELWTNFHIIQFTYAFQMGLRTACDFTNQAQWSFQFMFELPF